MRNFKNIFWVITLMMFVAMGNVYAQNTGNLTDKVQQEKTELDQEKDKIKEKGEGKMKQERKRLQEKKEKMKGKADKEKAEMKKGMGKGKGEAKSYTDLSDDEMKLLEEKLAKAQTEKERQEIMKMIEAKKKKKGGRGDVSKDDASTGSATGSATESATGKPKADDNGNTTVTGRDDDDYDEKEGKSDVVMDRDYGIAKANDAKAKLEKKEKDLEVKQVLVRKGRERIAAAQERLEAAKAEGNLSESAIASRQAAIDRAAARIDKLEASIRSGKEAYAKNKAKLSDMYKDEN